MVVWGPDILGDEFEQCTLPLKDDDEGPVVATLVRALPRAVLRKRLRAGLRRPLLYNVDVLYVHGWSDYFFQKRLARFFTDRGARFFALDLRKYGRSLREGQTPGYVANLKQYDEEINAALAVIAEKGAGRKLMLFGHSTGGLVLSLWAAYHPGRADAVILNSPWLTTQLGAAVAALSPVIELQAKFLPLNAVPQLDLGFYTKAQEIVQDAADPVTINPEWRPERMFTVYAGWVDAIHDGHQRVADGLAIAAPVYTLLSRRSALPLRWSEELTSVDSVLDVDGVAEAALHLGDTVTIERLDGALHDVFLSRHEVRQLAYARLARWVAAWAAAERLKA